MVDENEIYGFDYVPTVLEKTGRGERSYDLLSRLLKDRIIFISGTINEYRANLIIAELLFLELENRESDIHIYINSPGGSVTAGLAIYDTIQHLQPDVCTYSIGQTASMGTILLAAGANGKRFSLPNSRIMIHQPWGGASGTAEDINIRAKEINRLKKSLYDILVKHTGKTLEEVTVDCDRDYYMDAVAAKEYGLIDEVLTPDSKSEATAETDA